MIWRQKGVSADLVLNIYGVEETLKLYVCVCNDPFRKKKNCLDKLWSCSSLLSFSIITYVPSCLKKHWSLNPHAPS